MKKEIEETLQCLVGLPLWGAGRTLNLLSFQFGLRHLRTHRHGKSSEVGTYALHVQCAWHIATTDRLLVASRDRLFEPGDEQKQQGEMSRSEGESYTWSESDVSLL